MSALATSMIHSTDVIGGQSEMVNAEMCKGVSKVTADRVTGVNQEGKFQIEFNMGENGSGNPMNMTWAYATEALRDGDYLKVISTISTVVA